MNDVRITPAQKKKVTRLLKEDPINAPYRIHTEVLGDMDPPEGVERTFNDWSRVQTYDGYAARDVLGILTEKLS